MITYMAVNVDFWDNLCELYPKSAAACRESAYLKREIILHYMETSLKMSKNLRETGIPNAIALGENNLGTPTSD